uniref:Reverse transcriptase Ty1/copia-type domain-containing protein n=1 Tax=Chromera velia CCMP2878 TaxID=1169474 RepID=A0A0G4IAC4_9ALVE|eukprot:Cvel_12454.t1-p1 / transcript=Cvel_12454.t1 / gene=Cvel_12454 / organism=Chromera_velia_CCMP2878 / gene_product=hypothetical protein / transcript_product=hypothetical protein / location=Cvel_scaffold815:57519-63340(+) / protein_length=1172 / sequence_SO=supercontig / SO=protein_coding / is_pseudo=false
MSLVPLVRLGRVIHLLLCLRCPTLHTRWLRHPQVMVPLHLFPLLRTPTRLCRRGTRPPTTPLELLVQQPPWQPFPVPSPGHSVQVVTRWSELAKKAIDQLAIFLGTPQKDVELWKESFHEVVDEVRLLDGPHALGLQDLSGIIRQKVSSGVREVLRSRTVQANQIYDPSWLLDTLDSLYFGPYKSHVRKHWRAVKALCPLASESVDTYFAPAAKVFGRLRRLVPAMAFGSEPFVPFEYSILLESLPAEGGAHRYVLAYLQDYTPMGLCDYLRRYEQQLGTLTPSATIWFSSAPPSRSSFTSKPNHPKCIYCRVAHPWRKYVKCIACGASPHADRSTYPAIAHICGCGKQGHLDAMCPFKLRASKKAANIHCATVSFASAAVISSDLVHGPHFGKDDGATVEAIGELYLEKVSTSITYTVKVLDTPVPVRTAGCNDSSEASRAVVYTTHSVTLDDVIFGDRLESITFLILPQSSIPFLFSKAFAQRLSVKMDYKDNVMVIPSPSGPDVTLIWIDLGEYYGLPLVQDDDSSPSLVGSDEFNDERSPLEDDLNKSKDEIDNSAPFCPLPFTMCTITSPSGTTTPALHSPPEGIAGVGVPVSTGETPKGVHVCVSGGETPEGVCMSVSSEEASIPSEEGVEGLKEPARPGELTGGTSTTAQDSVKATTGGDVKGLVGFSIPGVSFTKGAYVGARLHLDSLYLGASDCGPTHQLTVLEDFLPYGLAPRFATHSNSHKTVAFLENEQEAAAFVPLFGPDPMTESPPDTVTTPAPLLPADLPVVHATDPFLSLQPTQQPIPESAPPVTPPLASLFSVTPALLQLGTMVIGHSPKHSLLWVEEILGVLPSDGAAEGDVWYEVHVWGSHQRCTLSHRQWAPGYYSSGGRYVLYDKRASKHVVEIVELSHDQKEDQGWIDREVYIRTPISEVSRNVPHIPLLRVWTEKLQDDGTRKFKTHTVINGKQVPREGLSVATRLCPPEAVRIVLQIALDACKRRGVDLSFQKADVVQAYLQAPLPPNRPPLTAIPPSDHPDYGQFLWVLRKAVYGLPDAGKVFEDFLTSILCSLGWEPTLFPGVPICALLPIIWEMQDKACIVPLQAATDLVEQYRISIFKIPTESNLSDLLTKVLDLGALTRLISPSPSLSPVFGSEIMSSLPPLTLHDRPTMEKERRGDGEELTA